MLSLLALFLFPMTFSFWNHLKSKGPYPTVREKALMSWEFAHNNTPWGLVFLLGMISGMFIRTKELYVPISGGGFALADGSQESGMAKLLGEAMSGLAAWPDIGVQFAAIFAATFLTNFSANVPICNILIPVLQELVA